MRKNGAPEPNPAKEATIPGSLVSPVEGGVVNWPPPAYSPDTGLFYVQEHNGFNILYLTDPDPRGSMGLGGKAVGAARSLGRATSRRSIHKTGKARGGTSSRRDGGGGRRPAGDRRQAWCSPATAAATSSRSTPTNGKPLWHSRIGNIVERAADLR